MRFNENASLDSSQVQDRRGGGFGGGGTAVAVGGGGLGLVVLLVAILLGVNPGDLGSVVNDTAPATSYQQPADVSPNSQLASECRTGADANARDDCRIVGVVNSVQKYWTDDFSRRGQRYEVAPTRLFSGATNTACGQASTEVGPFYCPNDKAVYLDLSFFQELQQRFGAKGGPFAQAYVVAHEYGHHIQDLTGVLDRLDPRDTGPQGQAVRTELMADCLAGVWASNAVATGYIQDLTDQDIADGLNAAAAVGDDHIQKSMQGRVNPEKFTHGSSEQRQRWFTNGYNGKHMESCNTLSGPV